MRRSACQKTEIYMTKMKDRKLNPSFCLLTVACSSLLCRTLRGVTFHRRKVTKSRRAAARNPQGLGGGAFESLCKAETSYAPSYPQRIVTNGAPARPPSDRYLAKFGGSCISMTASKCRHELPCMGCKLCFFQVTTMDYAFSFF